MTQAYTEFRYLFPPRTEMKIAPGQTGVRKVWERFPNLVGQFKLNGTRSMIYVFPDGHLEFWNRHGERVKRAAHTIYEPPYQMAAQIANMGLPKGHFHVLDGELLHSKTKDVKDVAYMFDILVYKSEYLLGLTYSHRYNMLSCLMHLGTPGSHQYFPLDFNPVLGRMYLAQNFGVDKWDWMWEMAKKIDYCEGMVWKRTDAISALETGYREINNDGFMLRVRKPNPNYRH